MSSQDRISKLMWFLAGAAVGAGVTLLYAPQAGQKTRRVLRKKISESGEAVSEAGKELLERGREYYDKGLKIAEEAGQLLDRGRKLVSG